MDKVTNKAVISKQRLNHKSIGVQLGAVHALFNDRYEVFPCTISIMESDFYIKGIEEQLIEAFGKDKVVLVATHLHWPSSPKDLLYEVTLKSGRVAYLALAETGGFNDMLKYSFVESGKRIKKADLKLSSNAGDIHATYHPEDGEDGETICKIIKANHIVATHTPRKVPATISIISYNSAHKCLQLRDIPMNWDVETLNLDLLYGEGFGGWHKDLIKRLDESEKGITLFHGQPGCGKTHYIRKLTAVLNAAGKKVVFIPHAIFEKIGSPEFTEFMLDNFTKSAKATVFVLEDAENLLKKRENNSDADKVSNLLNLGDGILNDLFKIQIIATFNTDLENIDPAVLRAGRLLAKKEFKPLKKDEAIKLAKHLKVVDTTNIVDSMSVASVFELLEKQKDLKLVE